MKFVSRYKPSHYEFFLKTANKLIGNHTDIDSWVKSYTTEQLKVVLRVIDYLKIGNKLYLEECSKFITVSIRLFILELDLDTESVSLDDDKIINIVNRMETIIKSEYAYKSGFIKYIDRNYTLLSDKQYVDIEKEKKREDLF